MGSDFIKKIENFKCENCEKEVKGNGYTNHCPSCLWSKHVDINPGDRLEDCLGLMEPVEISKKGDNFIILHRCLRCGFKKNNKADKEDDLRTFYDNMI